VSQARIHQIQTEVAHDQIPAEWTAAVARVHVLAVEVLRTVANATPPPPSSGGGGMLTVVIDG